MAIVLCFISCGCVTGSVTLKKYDLHQKNKFLEIHANENNSFVEGHVLKMCP